MYGGITQGLFPVTHVERESDLLRYRVGLPTELLEGLRTGASVAINGVCQTVVDISGSDVQFDAIAETLRLTNLGELVVGAKVSVERSLKWGDEIGGHELAGHIRGVGRLRERIISGNDVALWVEVPAVWMKYLLPKGFVAVEGSSLTIGHVREPEAGADVGLFSLHLIPETLRLTALGIKPEGAALNIELDARTVAIVDTVERVLRQRGLGPDLQND